MGFIFFVKFVLFHCYGNNITVAYEFRFSCYWYDTIASMWQRDLLTEDVLNVLQLEINRRYENNKNNVKNRIFIIVFRKTENQGYPWNFNFTLDFVSVRLSKTVHLHETTDTPQCFAVKNHNETCER